jgi:hypothetical protein
LPNFISDQSLNKFFEEKKDSLSLSGKILSYVKKPVEAINSWLKS